MKKLICILVVVLFMMTFVSCGERESENSDNSTSSDINYENTRHTVTVAQPDDSLLLDANVMAEFIPRSVILTSTLENPRFNYRYFVFICNFEKNQPDFCYYSPVPVDSDGNLHIDIATSSEIIWQVFGADWNIAEHIDQYTKKDDTTVYHPTEIGWGMQCYYPSGYVYSSFNSDKTQVVTTFEMFGPDDSSGDPDHKSYGRYKIIYDVMGADDQTFLRFNRFEKE